MAKWYKLDNGNLCRHHDNVDEVRKELQEVANALGLPIESERVMSRWMEMGNDCSGFVYDALIKPMYFVPKVVIYKNDFGQILRVHSDVDRTKKELQAVADELGLPLNDQKVFTVWSERGNAFRHQLFEDLLKPLYG